MGGPIKAITKAVNHEVQGFEHTVVGSALGAIPVVGSGVSAVESGVNVVDHLAGAKDVGQALTMIPGSVVDFYVGAAATQAGNAARVAGNITGNKDLKNAQHAIQLGETVAQDDPTDSLKVIGGAIGVAGAVVTGGTSAAAGVASIAAGLGGIALKTAGALAAEDAGKKYIQASADLPGVAGMGETPHSPSTPGTSGGYPWFGAFERKK